MVFDCGHGAAHSVFASELLAECAGAGAKAAVWVKRRMAAASLCADNFLNAAGGSATPSFAVSPASAPASPCLRSLCALESSCFRIQRKQAAGRLQERGQPRRRRVIFTVQKKYPHLVGFGSAPLGIGTTLPPYPQSSVSSKSVAESVRRSRAADRESALARGTLSTSARQARRLCADFAAAIALRCRSFAFVARIRAGQRVAERRAGSGVELLGSSRHPEDPHRI